MKRIPWKLLLWLVGLGPLLGLAGLVGLARMGDLPETEALANPKTDFATRVYSFDGKVLGRYYTENRSDARFETLPPHLVDALTSTEDARFYDHSGIDFIGLARAIAYMGKRGGGSTVTQQLAKLLFTDKYETTSFFERAVLQKPKEWIIASRLERHYTKEEIVALYLNRYDFINQAVGIESAANVYFNKPASELNVQESAMLVGMLKNSALYNPLRRPELVRDRRNVVLAQMVKYNHLEPQLADSLQGLPLGLQFQRVSHDEGAAPYFRETLRAELKRMLADKDEDGQYVLAKADGSAYDIYRDGLRVITTIDSRMQAYAENAVHRHLAGELQESFELDLRERPEEVAPFFEDIEPEVRQAIIDVAMRDSDRYKKGVGKLCPACNRPGYYIESIVMNDGHDGFKCGSDKGGCGHVWRAHTDKELREMFKQPVDMKVFSHQGAVDTVLSPLDSILHRKAILHAGLVSVEPATGHIKAWVGGIDYKHFQYDNVGQSRRQVGSTFKPFVYATALRLGADPCDEFPNQKTCIDLPRGSDPRAGVRTTATRITGRWSLWNTPWPTP